jgi:hypothetical protein
MTIYLLKNSPHNEEYCGAYATNDDEIRQLAITDTLTIYQFEASELQAVISEDRKTVVVKEADPKGTWGELRQYYIVPLKRAGA